MTAHTHTTLVDGCYRCDLGRDEMKAIEEERDRLLVSVMRKLVKTGGAMAYDNSGTFYVETDAVLLPITEDEFMALEDVMEEGE